jgi:hypothetical protein
MAVGGKEYSKKTKAYIRARNDAQMDNGATRARDAFRMTTFHPSSFILHPCV